VKPSQTFLVLGARAAEPEDAARDDRAVAARRLECVQRLREQCRLEARATRGLAATLDHVGGDVAAVHVVAGPQPRHEEPPRAASRVERRLAALDERAVVVDLRPADVEERPPVRDEPVVPGLRLFGHGARHRNAPREAAPAPQDRGGKPPAPEGRSGFLYPRKGEFR
jgi:hypothetical protein